MASTRVLLTAWLCALALPGVAALAQDSDGGEAPDAAAPVVEPAAPVDAGSSRRLSDLFGGPPSSDAPPPAPVTYHEDVAFQIAAPFGQRDAIQRARQASQALTAAIDAAGPAVPNAADSDVIVKDGAALIRVRGYVVTAIYAADARASGFPTLESYAEHLETRLGEFVPAQRRRGSLQRTALHIFLSVFIGLITVVALRQLRNAFDRADDALSQRRESLDALTILRVPVLSGEAVGGVLAFLLDIGRVFALVITVGAACAAILGQFDRTRPMLGRLVDSGASAVLQGLQAIGSAVPNLLLGTLIVVGLHAGLRVLHVLLEGVRNKRVVWTRLPPARVPVFKAFATWVVVLIGAPMVIAAAFGRFGTPLETLAVGAGVVGLLACVPAVANWVAGGVMLWRQNLKEGDWIDVHGLRGEVSIIRLTEVTVVPETGGSVTLPHLYLLLRPVHRMKGPPDQHVTITLEKTAPVRELLEKVQAMARSVDENAVVRLVELGDRWLRVDVHAASLRTNTMQDLWLAISDAVDRGELKIIGKPGVDA